MPHVTERLAGRSPVSSAAYEPFEPVAVLSWPLLTFVGVLMVSFIIQSVQFVRPGRTMATIAGTILAVAYLGLLGTFTIQMRWFAGPYHGIIPLVFLIATAKGADTGAYTVGRLAGRHKLWPSAEPEQDDRGSRRRDDLRGVSPSLIVAGSGPRILLKVPTLGWGESVGLRIARGVRRTAR